MRGVSVEGEKKRGDVEKRRAIRERGNRDQKSGDERGEYVERGEEKKGEH